MESQALFSKETANKFSENLWSISSALVQGQGPASSCL
jgi:hypothetical protein